MKKLLLIALLSGAGVEARAQSIAAGTVVLGGNVGYYHNSQENPSYYNPGGGYGYPVPVSATTTTSQFSLAPSVGFFVANNLAIGINGNYTVNHTVIDYSNNFSNSDYKNKSLQVGPFVQYYQMLTEQFGFVGTLGGGYQYTTIVNSDLTSKGFYTGLTPSIVFFPIPKFSIGASIGNLGYSHLTTKADNNSAATSYKSSGFGANFGFNQLTFSAAYFFGR